MQLDDLYQEIILDHYRHPRHFGRLPAADRTVRGQNPLCGDQLVLDLRLEGDRIADVAFEGQGCAISTAAASLMTEVVVGRTVEEALRLFEAYHRMVTEGERPTDLPPELAAAFERLEPFSGVGAYPARVKCATLAWHALASALKGDRDVVSTE